MPTVTKSIGITGGRDFSTLQTWEDSLPADLVSDGNSYVGECYNDAEFTAGVDFSAHTTDSTHTVTLTVAAGQSFQDDASVRTNALKYDTTKGVGVVVTSGYTTIVNFSGTVDYCTVSRLQFNHTGGHATGLLYAASGSNHNLVKDLLFETANGGSLGGVVGFIETWNSSKVVNVVVIVTGGGSDDLIFEGRDGTYEACTAIRLTDNAAAGRGFNGGVTSTGTIMKSCASFGFSSIGGSGGFDTANCNNNATDLASGLPGSANQHSVTFSTITPFVGASAATEDLRAIAGTPLVNNGFLDATNAPKDISKFTRSATPTIGHWEVAAASVSATLWSMAGSSQTGGSQTFMVPSGMGFPNA